MALVTCLECERQITDLAAACPHCGAPRVSTHKRTTPPSRFGVLGGFVAGAKEGWAESKERAWHDFWQMDLINGIVGKPPSGWVWGVLPFFVMAYFAGAYDLEPTNARWIFPAAFGVWILRCIPYWLKKRDLRRLDDRDLQELFARVKGLELGDGV